MLSYDRFIIPVKTLKRAVRARTCLQNDAAPFQREKGFPRRIAVTNRRIFAHANPARQALLDSI